jgi:predicted lipase
VGSAKSSVVAISDALYRKFELLAQYAAAAYCPDNFNRQNSQLRCQANNCPRVQSANTRVVWSFSKTPQTDNSGFVAIDHTHQTIVISFRGSESVRNYVTFFDTHLVPIELCPSCYSSSGYWRAWLEVREDVTTAAKQAHLQYPGYTLVVTGHSLGGAIATLAAADLRDNGAIVDLVRE